MPAASAFTLPATTTSTGRDRTDPLYMSPSWSASARGVGTPRFVSASAKKNTQLHVISGASLGKKTNNAMFVLTTLL